MYEVKVYDNTGKLKKVISAKTLSKRMDKLINSPSLKTNPRKKTAPTPIPAKTGKKLRANRA